MVAGVVDQAVVGKHDALRSPGIGPQGVDVALGPGAAVGLRQQALIIAEPAAADAAARGIRLQGASGPAQLLGLFFVMKLSGRRPYRWIYSATSSFVVYVPPCASCSCFGSAGGSCSSGSITKLHAVRDSAITSASRSAVNFSWNSPLSVFCQYNISRSVVQPKQFPSGHFLSFAAFRTR